MKPSLLLALSTLAWFSIGCATSTLDSRKQERYGSYSSLSSEQKASVDVGEIKVGMSMDAVYIAWGKPNQILASETAAGMRTRWIYTGTRLQGYNYWTYPGFYGPYSYGYRGYAGPSFVHDYAVLNYVRAEVIFDGSVVAEWRTLPKP